MLDHTIPDTCLYQQEVCVDYDAELITLPRVLLYFRDHGINSITYCSEIGVVTITNNDGTTKRFGFLEV